MKPFMSAEPRAYSLPSRSSMRNGSLAQSWPSTGTTSVCPDSTIPPSVRPSADGSVANRLALRRSGDAITSARTPWPARPSRTDSIRSRLELRLVVSKATRRSSH